MSEPVSSKAFYLALENAGWYHFQLDNNFQIIPPCEKIAYLLGTKEDVLIVTPFSQFFVIADRPNIEATLSNLQHYKLSSDPLIVHLDTTDFEPIEIMFLPRENEGEETYTGFLRPIPQPILNLARSIPENAQAVTTLTAHLSQQMMAVTDRKALLEKVIQSLKQDFGYAYNAIFLYDFHETTLSIQTSSQKIASFDQVKQLSLSSDTLIGEVAVSGKAQIISNADQHHYQVFDYFNIDVQTEIAIPLTISKHVLGVLHIQSPDQKGLTVTDLYQLQPIANQLSMAMENVRLFEEHERRMAELATFNQIGIILAEHRDVDTVFSQILDRIRSLLQVEAVSFLILENNELRFKAAVGGISEELQSFTLTPGQGIAWSAIEQKSTVRVDNVKNDPRHFSGIDTAIDFATHSLVAVPVQSQDRMLGVLEVINPSDNQPFNRDDEVALEFIVSSLAIVIENSRLFSKIQKQVDHITGLLEASHALGNLDLQATLNTIVQEAGKLLEADHTVVYLANHKMSKMEATASYSLGEMQIVPTPSFNFDEGTVGWVIRNKKSLRINNVQADPRFIQMTPQSKLVGNLVAVPLMVQQDMIGALEATHKMKSQDFTEDDEALLSAFASQAAFAIYNARLYQESEKQVKALTTLTETSQIISKAHLLEQLLDVVLDLILPIINAEGGSIFLMDQNNETLQIEASRGMSDETINRFNKLKIYHTVGTFGEAYRKQEIIEVANSATHPQVFRVKGRWEPPKSFTTIPLSSGDDFIGVMMLHGLPDDDTRPLLQAVADMAAVAIDKARLFQETDQRLAEVSTLYTLAEQMTQTLDITRLTELSTIILKHALGCSGCCLFLQDEAASEKSFDLKAYQGWSDGESAKAELDYITLLVQQLATKSYPTFIKDVTKWHLPNIPQFTPVRPKSGPIEPHLRSAIIIPLVAKDELHGAIVMCDTQPDAFGQADGRLLSIAAAQISAAIENISLYDNLEKRAIELEVALKEVAEANRLKSEFVQNVSHELRTPLTFILSYIELMLEGVLGDIPDTIHEKLVIVAQKTQTITRLVEDIISLQKVETGNLQRQLVSPHEIITRATHGAVARAEQYGITITSSSSSKLPTVYIDIDRISQVFDNLVANALKFSQSGSVIQITAEQDKEMIKFSVKDQGIGIPEDKLGKIFDRFYQVDGSTTRRYSGAGLGLAIIKQIIEVHGGRITVSSVVEEGTTFTFWLPIQHEAPQIQSPVPSS